METEVLYHKIPAPSESIIISVIITTPLCFRANIVIATPGRLEDMFRRKADGLDLASSVKSLDVLVLDEADRQIGRAHV